MDEERITLQEAIESLYDIAVVQRKATSPSRLRRLADYCIQELAVRGLAGAERDATIPGAGRPKQWDVAWRLHEKYRLGISLKSILSNVAGTVPNRIDDLMGEVANAQLYSPEIVLGYLMVFDIAQDATVAQFGRSWYEVLEERLKQLSGRRAPAWSTGMIESFALVQVDFSTGPRLLTAEEEISMLFDELVLEVKRRNPSLQVRGTEV